MTKDFRQAHAWLTGYSDALELNSTENRKHWDADGSLLAAYDQGWDDGAVQRVAVSA
jgi:hypothetical protein